MPFRIRTMATTLLLLAALGALGLNAYRGWTRLEAVRTELEAVRSQVAQARDGARRLDEEAARQERPAWLALLARARLNFKDPGETVVFVYKSEESDILTPPQTSPDPRPAWRIWLDRLLGRRD